MHTVLILLATYNGEKYIQEMTDSIIGQDFDDWKLVLSDDGSTDNTADILQSYSERYPDKILHYKSGKRFGNAQDHFMHLLANFKDAPYIMFCDQDDVWHKDKIRLTLQKIKEVEKDSSKPAIVHTDLRVVDGNLNVIDNSFMHFSNLDGSRLSFGNLLVQNVVTGCTMMINKALADMAVTNKAKGKILMHDWWLALIAANYGQCGFLNEATIDYRQHGNNVVGAKNIRSASYIVNKIFGGSIKKSIFDTSIQAECFYNSFRDVLTDENKLMLKAFSELYKSGFLKRKLIYSKYKLYKTGIVRKTAQFLFG